MGMLVALAVGYLFGAKTGGKDLDQLMTSLKALTESNEFADVVSATRAHVAHSLREAATMVDGVTDAAGLSHANGDLVDRVRHLFGTD